MFRPTLPCSADVLAFLGFFIAHKRANGSASERAVYASLDPSSLVTRLFTQRPLMFMTAVDQYVLKDGTDGADPSAFDAIGTDAERAPLILASLLSYEEMQISALLGCASQCHFINRGGRGNQGEAGDRYGETHEPRGVYVGQVGCRFERPLRMEWCHMVIDPAQNIRSEGYGAASGTGAGTVPLAEAAKRAMLTRWAQLYRLAEQEGGWVVGGAPGHDSARLVAPPPAAATLASPDRRGLNFPLHSEVEAWWDADAPGARARWALLRCGDGRVRRFLDLAALRGRCRILAESFLLEANTRAAEASRREGREVRAYCHAVGLGLGVWQIAPEQRFVLVDAFAAAVEACDLPFVSDIDFAWMQDSRSGAPTSCGSAAAGTTLSSRVYLRNAVDFRFSKRDPAEPLAGRHAGKLLVAQFAWDSNAYVGNEFWKGMLSASGDPAAACCSTIAELFVPEINPLAAMLRGSVQERSTRCTAAAAARPAADL